MPEEERVIRTLRELPGVGPKVEEKLIEAGFEDPGSVAAASPAELRQIFGTEAKAKQAIQAARKAVVIEFVTAEKYEKRPIDYLTTGCQELNDILVPPGIKRANPKMIGGIRTGQMTSVYAEFGSGKTQVGKQLCINVQLPKEKGGLGGEAIFLDTDGMFSPTRLRDMAAGAGLDPNEALKRVSMSRVYSTDELALAIEKLPDMVEKNKKIKLIVIDSFTSMFRTEYAGRELLAPRSMKIGRLMNTLTKLAEQKNIAVYITAEAQILPIATYGPPIVKPAGGGTVLEHRGGTILYFRKSKPPARLAKIYDAGDLPPGEALFAITEDGVRDLEEKEKK